MICALECHYLARIFFSKLLILEVLVFIAIVLLECTLVDLSWGITIVITWLQS